MEQSASGEADRSIASQIFVHTVHTVYTLHTVHTVRTVQTVHALHTVHNLNTVHIVHRGARWHSNYGTMLQTERSRVRFPIMSLEFFSDKSSCCAMVLG